MIRGRILSIAIPGFAGLGFAFFHYSTRVTVVPMGAGSSSIDRLWIFPGISSFFLAAVWCVSLFYALFLLLRSFYRRGYESDSVDVSRKAGFVFLPFLLGFLPFLSWSTSFNGLTRFLPVVLHEAPLTLFILMLLGAVVQFCDGLPEASSLRRLSISAAEGSRSFMRSRSATVIVFLVSFVVYRMVMPFMPGLNGDEPHYLLIMQSLVSDGDLDINNNYVNQDYHEYIPGTLDRHVTIGREGTRYSTHPVGLAFLGALPYALGGYRGVLWFLSMCSALLSVQLFLLIRTVTGGSLWTMLLWAAISFSPPLLPYSAKVFPELPAALLIAVAYRRLAKGGISGKWEALWVGLCLAFLPWLQQRFILFAALLLGALVFRHIKKSVLESFLLALFPALSVAGLGLFYFVLYGDPMPSAPYASVRMDRIWDAGIFFRQGLWGLLFDQEFGIFLYSPLLLLFVAGLFRKASRDFFGVVWWGLMVLSIYVPAGGFTLKWFGSWAPMGRYMVVLIPLFADAIAHVFRGSVSRSFRWTVLLLTWITARFSWILLHTYDNWIGGENGRSKLLSIVTDMIDVPLYFPSLIMPDPFRYSVLVVWCVLLSGFSLYSLKATNPAKGEVQTGMNRGLSAGARKQPDFSFFR